MVQLLLSGTLLYVCLYLLGNLVKLIFLKSIKQDHIILYLILNYNFRLFFFFIRIECNLCIVLLACERVARCTCCMKHGSFQFNNVLLSMLLQAYITVKMAFNSYNLLHFYIIKLSLFVLILHIFNCYYCL